MKRLIAIAIGVLLLVGAAYLTALWPSWVAEARTTGTPAGPHAVIAGIFGRAPGWVPAPGVEAAAKWPLTVAEMPKDDPAVKLDIEWLGPCYFGSGLDDTRGEKLLEERFNVRLTARFLDDTAYQRKKPLMLSGGTIPDVVWENDPNVVQRDVAQGFLAEVPIELLQEYAPTYVRYINENSPVAWVYCNVKGKNYGLPTQNLTGIYPNPGVWRMDWLKKVGIEKVPETLDEMHEALKRCTFADPDGNGKHDTFGMSGTFNDWWWTSFADVFGAHGVTPFDWQLDNKGDVTWGGITPEAKQALATLRAWVAEGIIDPQFTTDRNGQPTKDLENKFKRGQLAYLYYYGTAINMDESSPNNFINTMKTMQPDAEVVPGRFPTGPAGKRGGRQWGPGGNIIAFGANITRDPRKLIRVLTMLEELTKDQMDTETHLSLATDAMNGRRGIEWEYKKIIPGDFARTKRSGTKLLPPYDNPNVAKQNVKGQFFVITASTRESMEASATEFIADFRAKYQQPEYALLDLLGKPDVVPSSGKYLESLRQLQLTTYTKIVKGDLPLDEFERFVVTWRRSHGDELLAEARTAQAAKLDLYKQLGVDLNTWK